MSYIERSYDEDEPGEPVLLLHQKPFGSPCEGGCGCSISMYLGDPWEVGETKERLATTRELITKHNRFRCHAIKLIRQACEQRIPDVTVTVHADKGPNMLLVNGTVQGEVRIGLAPSYETKTAQIWLDCFGMMMGRNDDAVRFLADHTAEQMARVFDRPIEYMGGGLKQAPMIARDPYAGR